MTISKTLMGEDERICRAVCPTDVVVKTIPLPVWMLGLRMRSPYRLPRGKAISKEYMVFVGVLDSTK